MKLIGSCLLLYFCLVNSAYADEIFVGEDLPLRLGLTTCGYSSVPAYSNPIHIAQTPWVTGYLAAGYVVTKLQYSTGESFADVLYKTAGNRQYSNIKVYFAKGNETATFDLRNCVDTW